jgi:dinuclear metal center YbgI/SA1388 family protein
MLLRELTACMEALAPLHFAESWDNVGLLLGDPDQEVRHVLFTIDYTAAVAKEARALGCDAVVSYHPPWFVAMKRLTAPHPLFAAARDGIAIYSPHTALDVAPGGTNDVLADAVGLATRRPLRDAQPAVKEHKLVTFVPTEHADAVCNALFDAGAGRIGDYSGCSFRTAGTGTFLGGDGSNPQLGRKGQFERVDEQRIETRVPHGKLSQVVAALQAAHPYEEVAYDLLALGAEPASQGIGRIGELESKQPLGDVVERIKRKMGLAHALVAGEATSSIRTVAVCAGAGGELLGEAIAQKADLFVTGEMRHHDALRALSRGTRVICLLHSGSERAALGPLMQRLREKLPGLKLTQSSSDADPFSWN